MSSRGGLESPGGKVGRLPRSKELAVENEKDTTSVVSAPKKCRVRELEKLRFGERRRLALYRNRPPLMRQEGAAVRLVSCCTNPRKE